MSDTHVLELADGRELAWLEVGDPDGSPVFAFHGTPGSRRQIAVDEARVRDAGVRLVVPDRPGYGHSTWQPRRTLRGWADDVAALADHLGIDRFAVVGVSGGGPHAAVCAALLPHRVTGAALVSGVASTAEPGSEEGMMSFNVLLARVSRRSRLPGTLLFGLVSAVTRRWPQRALSSMVKQLPPADQEVLGRPEVQELMAADMRTASRTSGRAAAQDFFLFAHDWGFRLEDITVPVHVWQGTDDVNVPFEHGRRQAAAIPNATFHELPGLGHLYAFDKMEEIVGQLVS